MNQSTLNLILDEVETEIEDIEEYITYNISSDETGERIDKLLNFKFPDYSRTQIQLYIQQGYITVNESLTKSNYRVRENDSIKLQFPEPIDVLINPESMPLDVIYEDVDLIVINKQRGIVVHPAQGHYTGTLVNALLYHCKDLSGINGKLRPGIVHRIDKDTTGLLVVAKNDRIHRHLSEQFKAHTIVRKYVALVHGLIPNKEGTIIAPIGRHKTQRKKMAVDVENGRHAITHFTVLKHFNEFTLVELKLETGRTHQIRVHLEYIGYPVAGDPVYGYRKTVQLNGQALHAKDLGFIHPRSLEQLYFTSDLPEDFQSILSTIV
jgi:23S rRNA pseudouridine1911/1915/1917 synthase